MKLRNKILFLNTALVLLLGVSIMIYAKTSVISHLTGDMKEQGGSLARHLAEMVVSDILTESNINLHMRIKHFMDHNEQINYIFVAGPGGEILAHTFEGAFPSDLLQFASMEVAEGYSSQELVTDIGQIINIGAPVLDGKAGFVNIGFSKYWLMTHINHITDMILVMLAAVTALCIATAAFFSSLLARPLSSLSRAAKSFGEGKLDHEISVKSKDELGQLGQTFNDMVRDLKSRTVSHEYLSNLIDSMTDMVIVVNEGFKVKSANKSALSLLDYREEVLVGRDFSEICKGSDDCYRNKDILLQQGSISGFETSFLTSAGQSIPVVLSASIITGRGSEEISIVISARDNTQFEQANRRLEEERDRAQKYLDVAGVMLVGLDENGEITLLNRKGAEVLDCPEPEALGKNWFDTFIPESDRLEIKRVFEMIMSGEVEPVESYENRVVSASGRAHVIKWRNTVLKDNSGTAVGTLSSGEDITKRKSAEDSLIVKQVELRNKHAELNALFREVEVANKERQKIMDSVGDMIILSDKDGEIKRINRAVSQFTGFSEKEIMDRKWEDIFSECGLEAHTLHSGSTELRHLPSGKWFALNSYPFTDPDLQFSGTVLTLHDTSEIKGMTAKLEITNRKIEADRKKLQDALDEISALIESVIKSTDHKIRFFNPHIATCYEVKNCGKIDCPCYGKEAMRCWKVAGTYCGGEVQGAFAQKYGNCSICDVYLKATNDPIYQIGEHFNNMMHILEFKNSELHDAYEELKSAQSQMLQKEKMASIGQLAAGVAHEINNPAGFITSNLGTLDKYVSRLTSFVDGVVGIIASTKPGEAVQDIAALRKKLKIDYVLDDIHQLVRESEEGTARITSIVKNLKTFSRVDEAEYKLADINECIESTLSIAWNELKYKAEVEKDYGDIPPVKCYPQQLNQVILNLLINAAHAIEKQGYIKIRTWNGEGCVKVAVSDTGTGIPEEKLGMIFDPFFTTKPVGKGTGLGLSIAYEIVKKHSGSLDVESRLNEGTTFTITIPVQVNSLEKGAVCEGTGPSHGGSTATDGQEVENV